MTTCAALYCRISKDQQGRREGVEAQERWGRAYAAEHCPDLPVEVFADNHVSAAEDDAYRPEYERFREWARAGRIAQVWAVEQSRIERHERWFQLVRELLKADIETIHTRRNGVVQLGQIAADITALVDIHGVRKIKARTRDKHEELAQQGRPTGVTPFGYRFHNRTAEDDERYMDWTPVGEAGREAARRRHRRMAASASAPVPR